MLKCDILVLEFAFHFNLYRYMVVSHDRHFLDAATTDSLHISVGDSCTAVEYGWPVALESTWF
jgi:ATPase subunit of ABC transporter with duplicated ATPase domains